MQPLFFATAINYLKKFVVGKYYWFIANTTNGNVENAGGIREEITTISSADFLTSKPDKLFAHMHPMMCRKCLHLPTIGYRFY